MIPIWLAIVIFLVAWVVIAGLYADGLLEKPLYIEILTTKDWNSNEEINKQIEEYGMIRLALDLFMISPLFIIFFFTDRK